MKSQGTVYPVGHSKQNASLDKGDQKHIQDHSFVAGPECCSLVVLIHGSLQLLKSALPWLQNPDVLDKLQPRYHDPFGKPGSKHQYHHKSDAKYIQAYPKVEHPHVISQITTKKSSAKQADHKADHNQHRLVGDGDDHQHQGGNRNGQLILLHIKNLHRLSAGGRRCDAAEEKSYKGIQCTVSHFHTGAKGSHHIKDDHRFSQYKKHHAHNAKKQISCICFPGCTDNVPDILTAKYQIHGKSENHNQK